MKGRPEILRAVHSLKASSGSLGSRSRRDHPAEFSAATIRKQLRAILQSQYFAGSERLCKFLQYVVEKTLAGEPVKEFSIGVDVYGRDASYDPRIDAIVRVEARRLRLKLREYYKNGGRDSLVWITLPKGGYLPIFRDGKSSPLTSDSNHTPSASQHSRDLEGTGRVSKQPRIEGPAARNSIAVLPFVNATGDPGAEYLSDGLTDELISALTHLDGLHIVGRTSAQVFKGKAQDLREIGKLLNVESILEGSVRKSGSRLRITAQLTNATDGFELWSEVYEEELRDFFEIQDAITKAIIASLQPRLEENQRTRLKKSITKNIAASELYLKGRTTLFEWNPRSWEKATQYFEKALVEDPNCAPAYTGLAESLFLPGVYGLAAPSEVVPQARKMALRGLKIDDSMAEAHLLLGLITAHYDWRWQEGCLEIERALQSKPGYALGHYWYSWTLAVVGHGEQALREAIQALTLEPFSVLPRMALARVFYLERQFDRAAEEYQQAIRLNPSFPHAHSFLGLTYTAKSMFAEAIEEAAEGARSASDSPASLAVLGYCHAVSGDIQRGQALLIRLTEISKQSYIPAGYMALIYLGLGDDNCALDWLEKACEERHFPIGPLRMGPFSDKLRSSPRFQALLRKMNLASTLSKSRTSPNLKGYLRSLLLFIIASCLPSVSLIDCLMMPLVS